MDNRNTIDRELVLQLCRFADPNRERLAALMEAEPDWACVLGHLLYNRMGGAAYKTLRDTGLLNRPNREFRNTLKTVYDDNRRRGAAYRRGLERLGELLDGAPFAYAALKGACLCGIYPDGVRTSNDVDLLVEGKDITALSERLLAGGFRQGYLRGGLFVPSTRAEIVSARLNRGETVPFIRETGDDAMPFLEVDINFSLDFKARQESDAVADMLGRAERTAPFGRLYTLAPEHFLIHLCAHLYKEAATKAWVDLGRDQALYKYADLYMLLRAASEDRDAGEARWEINLPRFVNAVRQFGQEKACCYALSGAAALFGLEEGPPVLAGYGRLSLLLDSFRPANTDFFQEVYDPAGDKTWRHDLPIREWVFCPDRKERLYAVADESAWIPRNAHYLLRFGRVR